MYTTEFVDAPLGDLLTRVQTLKHEGMRFIQLCAEFPEGGIDLVYTFYDETRDNALNLCVSLPENAEVPSIQGLYFAAFSYENEAHDLFGVNFINMKLDFGGHFFNLAETSPMTVITPEMKAEREKAAKLRAAKAAKEAKAAREAAEAASAERALTEDRAAADAKAVAAVDAMAPKAASDASEGAPAPKPTAAERAAKMEAKLAAMDPEKAAKVRAALEARAKKEGE
ncbi:NADH-quinone oxidoreductase subunit C [Candidatus Collinsella stercoripullorum]|uniref:NADH-quinone oxidoreductase subunit C n=1 Tax=Candidatus Collinsella stercoripullorum TaxID=2838522 RepID=UPI001C3A4831|nr:NADH-quinone oxidoreductase subunit C [Candidatus Collinsella stercoripullorum]HJA00328.1 NADH-quinone oxidoreductase subunit C [Candidatus Collinsella stercoripullorum]